MFSLTKGEARVFAAIFIAGVVVCGAAVIGAIGGVGYLIYLGATSLL